MIVDCPYCESKVDAKKVGDHEEFDRDSDPAPFRVSLTVCPNCDQSIVAGQYRNNDQYGDGYEPPTRLWPAPKRTIGFEIPSIVSVSLEEADRCFRASAFTATAVMCGRAIEGVCVHHKTKAKTLANGLKELRDKGVIDDRLFEWSDALRHLRNIGAHATDERVTREDATDLLDFAHAICEYIFVLNAKFERFKKRREDKDG